MNYFEAALSFGGILTDADIAEVKKRVSVRELKAGEHFVRFGELTNEIAFVEKGILRSYDIARNGDEVTKYFAKPNQFYTDLESYYSRKPCENAIQAVTDAVLIVIDRKTWEYFSVNISNFYIYSKTVTEATLLNKIKDNDFLNYGSAEDKYRELFNRYPEIIQQVPLQYIASYLKITPQSLSRIRKSFVQKP
jgi:CRP-like cAMP-binding protein